MRLARRSIEKPVYKEKMRLRSYGVATADSTVFMELKRKYRQLVYKRRAAMSLREAKRYLDGGAEPERATQITREIDYFRSVNPGIAPSVFIASERSAFYAKDDPSFRMTFDTAIVWRKTDLSLTSRTYGESLLGPDQVLLEVKSSGAIPLWLISTLSQNRIFKTSFSKYGSAYVRMMSQIGSGSAVGAPDGIYAQGLSRPGDASPTGGFEPAAWAPGQRPATSSAKGGRDSDGLVAANGHLRHTDSEALAHISGGDLGV